MEQCQLIALEKQDSSHEYLAHLLALGLVVDHRNEKANEQLLICCKEFIVQQALNKTFKMTT